VSVPKPVPAPEGLNAEWYAHCAEESLHFQRCSECGKWRHPPRFLCASCGSASWRWEPSSGRGSLYTWTVTHQAIHPAYADEVPYVVGVIETDEGTRLVGAMPGVALGELRLGLAVRVGWERRSDQIILPVWFARDDDGQ